jgi:hypothetical protein
VIPISGCDIPRPTGLQQADLAPAALANVIDVLLIDARECARYLPFQPAAKDSRCDAKLSVSSKPNERLFGLLQPI